MRILVVTSCTGEKKISPENKLILEDFKNKELLIKRENELEEYKIKAADMYTGMQHLRLMEGISGLRNRYKQKVVDLAIVSAGYGLLDEEALIVPYEVTFNSMKNEEIIEWSKELRINENLSKLIESYDLVFFLLGDKYLKSLRLPFINVQTDKKLIFLASKTSKSSIPAQSPYYFLEVGQEDAKSFKYGLIGLKGYLFKLLSQDIIENGLELFKQIYEQPGLTMELLNKYRKNEEVIEQIALTAEFELDLKAKGRRNKGKTEKAKGKHIEKMQVKEIIIPKEFYAKNYGLHGMKYFIPECDDRVDPNYDFIKDCSDSERNPYESDLYAHEIFRPANYDGILVSKVSVEANKKKKSLMEQYGVHKYIRCPKSTPIMGDCGAFSYIDEEFPPYSTEEILEYYETLGFDIGVSIDHLIVGKITSNEQERVRRYNITKNNADDFIRKYKDNNYTFTPSGIAQGWDPISYRNSVADLIDMGYKHISIGGLALSKTEEVINVLKEISQVVKEETQLHLFGVQRIDAIDIFRKLGITSFDSSSYLRKAWTDSKKNYFLEDPIDPFKEVSYPAIRIPQSDGNIVKKLVKEGIAPLEVFEKSEEKCLKYMRLYDKGEIDLETTLEELLKYTELTGKAKKDYEHLYRRTLQEKPWKNCDCKICKEVGVETIIFRGNNRNRRRGFHNTYVFYKMFTDILKNK